MKSRKLRELEQFVHTMATHHHERFIRAMRHKYPEDDDPMLGAWHAGAAEAFESMAERMRTLWK